jgi:hypothetical protein
MVAVEQRAAGAVIKLAQMAAGEQAPVADGEKLHRLPISARQMPPSRSRPASPMEARPRGVSISALIASPASTPSRSQRALSGSKRAQLPPKVPTAIRPSGQTAAARAQICAGMVSRAISRGGCPGARSHTASARS